MKQIKTIAIIGAGAVGTFYGGKLAKAGFNVQFQSKFMFASKTKAMHVKSVWGDFDFPIQVYSDINSMDKADFIIISAKSCNPQRDLIQYSTLIKKIRKQNSIILVLQNGINMEEKLGKVFPKNPILGGLAFTCINRITHEEIHHIDYGQIKIGSLQKKFEKEAKLITKIFLEAGIDTKYEKNLRKARYEKLLWNVPFNSLSVIGNKSSTKEIIEFKPLFDLAKKLMLEVRSIAKKENIDLKKSLIDEMLERTKKMKPYKTSMLLDFENGNTMEVESILGEIYRNGKSLKAITPHLDYTYSVMQFLNRKHLSR
jgi:2-dehydropantoate 2-reductase